MVMTLPLKSTSSSSSQAIESRSRWLVGSSSSSTSGLATSAWASATRFLVPPDSEPTMASLSRCRRCRVSSTRCSQFQPSSASISDLQGVQVGMLVGRQVLLDHVPGPARPALAAMKTVACGSRLGSCGDVGDAQVLLQLQGAVVGFFQSGQDFEQRGLAGAVAADQADALAGFQRKIRVVQQGDVPKSELSVKKCN